jgi:hypothetical protein
LKFLAENSFVTAGKCKNQFQGGNMANENQKKNSMTEQDVDVLYQKLGDRWFAFSIINDEVFMAPITEEKIIEIKQERRSPDSETSAA